MRSLLAFGFLLFAAATAAPVAVADDAASLMSIPGMSVRDARKMARRPLAAKKPSAFAKTCKKVQGVNFLIKADISHHVPRADARAAGFTVIGSGRNCSPCPSGCDILYSNGDVAGKVGYYGPWSRSHGGNGCSRYYGAAGGAPAHSANAIIANARKRGKKLFLSNRRGVCYEWNSESRRVGAT